jgi:hypothetical protein
MKLAVTMIQSDTKNYNLRSTPKRNAGSSARSERPRPTHLGRSAQMCPHGVDWWPLRAAPRLRLHYKGVNYEWTSWMKNRLTSRVFARGNSDAEAKSKLLRLLKKVWLSCKSALLRGRREVYLRIWSLSYRLAGGHEEFILSSRYTGLKGLLLVRREAAIFRRNKRQYKAIAGAAKIVWVDPKSIDFKLGADLDICFNDILPGDWDVLRRASLEKLAKHRSIYQRFVLGSAWTDTDLFKTKYARRFVRGERIRGTSNPHDLALKYGSRIDALFDSMKRNGFVITRDRSGRLQSLPHLHIGQNGELMLGNNGNHRVAIAKILGLSRIPCWVRSRHFLWQQVREEVAERLRNRCPLPPNFRYAGHPDLEDLLEPERAVGSSNLRVI